MYAWRLISKKVVPIWVTKKSVSSLTLCRIWVQKVSNTNTYQVMKRINLLFCSVIFIATIHFIVVHECAELDLRFYFSGGVDSGTRSVRTWYN